MRLEKTCNLSLEKYKTLEVNSRNIDYLMNWLYKIYKIAYLPCTEQSYREKLAIDKTKLSIFNILLDDLADNSNIRDKELLEDAIRITKDENFIPKKTYLKLAKELWNECFESIKKYPRYEEFKDIFNFDMDQFIDSIKYSYLVNENGLDNDLESALYSAHNMMVMVFTDMDLMCSPSFDKSELRKIRPILYSVQEITHVGNILATYPREIKEKDYSSPIINYGIREGLIDKDTVENKPDIALEKLSYLVPLLKMEVESNFEKIEKLGMKINSVDIGEFSQRVRKIWQGFLQRADNYSETEFWKEKVIQPEIKTTMFSGFFKAKTNGIRM